MNLRQLEYFRAVAEELHFGRAARKMHVAQPPLSQQIKKLEDELGVLLFRRDNRNVSMTPEGRKFLCVVRNALGTLENGVEQVRMMSRGEVGRLGVGFVPSVAQSYFTEAVAEFRARHPGIVLDLYEMDSVEQRRQLHDGELDAGIVFGRCSRSSDLNFRVFLRDPYLLAVHRDHRFAEASSVRLEDLHGEDLIVFPRAVHPKSYDESLAVFHARGIEPNIVQEAASHHTKLALVSTGMGVGLVPSRMAAVCPDCVRLMPFDWQGGKAACKSVLDLAWRAGDTSPALACFLAVMEEFCPEPSDTCTVGCGG